MHEFQSRRHVALAIFALFIIVRTVVFSSSAFAQTQARVEWKAGRLSVSAEMAPLSEIVAEVARRTGIEVQGHENLQEKASVHFSDAPLVEGLENLLSGLNYTIMNKPLCPSCPSQVRVVIFGRGASLSHDLSSPPTPRAAATSKRTGGNSTVSDINQEAAETAPPLEDIQKLRNALRDSDPNVRQDALDKLAERLPSQSVDTLQSMVKNSDYPTAVRLQALEFLSQGVHADQATVLSALGDALQDKDAEVQAFAIQTLASQGSEGIDALRQAFGAADPSVKAMIVESVGSTPEAVPLLKDASSDSDESIRDSASALLEAANAQEKN